MSIVIFGKGPSLIRCTKEIIDEYEDIAICNYPVLNDIFLNLVKDREIKYHFANCGTFDNRYTNEINEELQIKSIINTNLEKHTHYQNFLQNTNLFTYNIREKYEKYFKNTYDFDPSTGIIALQYILDLKKYKKILLVGFDNFEKGEKMYYYSPNEMNSKMHYLIQNDTIKLDGTFNIISGHCPIKTEKYLNNIIEKNKNIKFNLITNMNFKNYINMKLII